jgi:hypothetical protein
MGMTIIYLEDTPEGISITAEHLGDTGDSERLAQQIIQNLLYLKEVYYSQGENISGHPLSPLIQ